MLKAILRHSLFVIPLAWYATFSTGCIPIDTLSLSPSGRYLSVLDTQAAQFWIWDIQEGKNVDCGWKASRDVFSCRFLTERKLAVVLADENGDKDKGNLYIVHWKSGRARKVAEIEGLEVVSCAFWRDKRLYYSASKAQKDGSEVHVCREQWLTWPYSGRDLFTSSNEIGYPSPSPSGRHVLAFFEDPDKGLCLYDRMTRLLRPMPPGSAGAWPTWVDDRRFVCVRFGETNVPTEGQQGPFYEDDEIGTLTLTDIHCGTPKRLLPCVAILDPPNYFAKTNEAIVTAYDPESVGTASGSNDVAPQVYAVNVDTGASRRLTEPPPAAGMATVSSKGTHVAFLSGSMEEQDDFKVKVLNLATGKITEPIHPPSLEEAREANAAKEEPFEIHIGSRSEE